MSWLVAVANVIIAISALQAFVNVARSNWHARQALACVAALDDQGLDVARRNDLKAAQVRHEDQSKLLLDTSRLLPRPLFELLGAALLVRVLDAVGRLLGVIV